jgi:hypothetical protein
LAVKLPRVLFLIVVVAELIHLIVAAGQHRVPLSHDGFQYFTLQYYFLNNALLSHEVAQWVPYMTQGTVGSLWYGIQASLLQSVLVHMPVLPQNANLLTVFHVGLFVDEMVLLTGTFLLARRFFSPTTVFFVAVCVVGSSVWLDQPYWNLKLHYAVPLLIELGHRWLETSKWRWCFLMINLLAVQMIGSLPYVIPVVSFAVVAYFACYGVANPRALAQQLRAFRWGGPALLAIAGGILSLAAAYGCFTAGADQLVSYNAYRNADGSNSLPVFLAYGGSTDLLKWVDMTLNLSPWMDFTLYSGMLVPPFLLLSVAIVDRRRVHFLLFGVTLLLFTLGTYVSVMLFYLWPGMKFFRHIGLVSPLVRVAWCFAAGVGFEFVSAPRAWQRIWPARVAAAFVALVLVVTAVFAFRLSLDHQRMLALVDAISNPGVDRPVHIQFVDVLSHRLWVSTLFAGVGALVVGVGGVVVTFRVFAANARVRQVWVLAVLLVLTVDIYHFKFGYLYARSDTIAPSQTVVTRAAPMTYQRRRDINLRDAAIAGTNPRLSATLTFSTMFRRRLQGTASHGAQYWTNNMFVFADEAGSTFQVDSWLKPLDQLMRTYWGVPIDDTTMLPPGVDLRELIFPLNQPGAGRISGVTEDKIRFFSRAYTVRSTVDVSRLMTDENYGGNILFVLPVSTSALATPVSISWDSQVPLSIDDSRRLEYVVEVFDANNLRVRIANPGSASWMFYSDVWHPYWRATVNGRQVPVYRADLAYKAVPLDVGENVVHLQFGSSVFSWCSTLLSMNALGWLGGLTWMMWTLAGRRSASW